MPELHMKDYTVLEAFSRDECPLCHLLYQFKHSYYTSMFHESIADDDYIREMISSNGFCHDHAKEIIEYNRGLPTAFAYRYLFIKAQSTLKKDHSAFRKMKVSCVVCSAIETKKIHFIDILKRLMVNDADTLKIRLLASKGFCVPHLRELLVKFGKTPKWFTEFHEKRYAEIIEALDRYIDFENFSLGENRPDLSREEQLFWRDAVRFMTGFTRE